MRRFFNYKRLIRILQSQFVISKSKILLKDYDIRSRYFPFVQQWKNTANVEDTRQTDKVLMKQAHVLELVMSDTTIDTIEYSSHYR